MYLTVEFFLHSSMEHGSGSGCIYLMFWYCFLNDLSVRNTFLTFIKKKTVWQFDVRNHVTQDSEIASISICPLCGFNNIFLSRCEDLLRIPNSLTIHIRGPKDLHSIYKCVNNIIAPEDNYVTYAGFQKPHLILLWMK